MAAEALTADLKESAEAAAERAVEAANATEESVSAKLAVIQLTREFSILSDRVFRIEAGLDRRDNTNTNPDENPLTNDRNNPDSEEYFADLFNYVHLTGNPDG